MNLGSEYLSIVSLIAAAITGLLAFLLLRRPEPLARACAALPRHRLAGMLFTAIALLWSALLINQMTLGELGRFKNLLYFLTPLSFYLIITYLDELLAARALGGLLMLIPTLMTDAARWHDSPLRLVVVTLAYVLVILGIWLVLSPYKFRVWTDALLGAPAPRRIAGTLMALTSAALLATGFATW